MTLADSKAIKAMTLAEMLTEAGITEFADWSHTTEVLPSGNPSFRPRKYQMDDLNHMAAHLPRSGLWSDPGVGKTLPLQAFSLWMVGLGNKVVAVMLPGLVPQFLQSFQAQFRGHPVSIEMLFGERGDRQKSIDRFNKDGWPDVLIMSYETFKGKGKAPKNTRLSKEDKAAIDAMEPDAALAKRIELAEAARIKQNEDSRAYDYVAGRTITAHNLKWQALRWVGYNMLICDEAHTVKKPSADIHQAVRDFVEPWDNNTSNGLILATGTPIKTNIEDAYGLINLLDPNRYGSATAFDAMHCRMNPQSKFRQVIEYYNMDYLYAGLYKHGRRVTKRQAFPEMPQRVVTEVSVVLHNDHKALYRKLVDEQVLTVGETLLDATQQSRMYQYVQQILLCPERFSDKAIKGNAILDAMDLVIDGLGDRKVIMFAWYQKSIDKLKEYYQGMNPVVINGNVTGSAREKAKATFINDPQCRLLIAQVESGGVGLDGFQHVCSYAIFAEIYGHPGGFEQAVGRIERSGQTESINVYLMVPKGTIAVKLRNDLLRKEANANSAIRDAKTLLADMLGETS